MLLSISSIKSGQPTASPVWENFVYGVSNDKVILKKEKEHVQSMEVLAYR